MAYEGKAMKLQYDDTKSKDANPLRRIDDYNIWSRDFREPQNVQRVYNRSRELGMSLVAEIWPEKLQTNLLVISQLLTTHNKNCRRLHHAAGYVR